MMCLRGWPNNDEEEWRLNGLLTLNQEADKQGTIQADDLPSINPTASAPTLQCGSSALPYQKRNPTILYRHS